MAASTYFNTVQKLYIAFYQRPADPSGLVYWASRLDAAGGSLSGIIDAFATSAEAQALYGTINANTIGNVVDAIYQALFNRAPDAAGKQFYVNGFAEGRFTPGSIALDILNGAQGDDRVAINNKVTVANRFTEAVDGRAMTSSDFGTGTTFAATYAGDTDAQAARTFLAGVTSSPATLKTADEVKLVVQTTIADPTDPIKSAPTGQIFTLTTSIEALTGTAGNDTFIATNTTLNTGDNINGGAGNDTLDVTIGTPATPIVTLNSVENVKLTAGVTNNGSLNAGNWTGVQKVTVAGLGVELADGVAGGATGWAVENLQNNVTLGLSNVSTAADGNAALFAGFASGKVGSSTATLSLDLNGVVGKTAGTGVANIQVATAGTDKFTKLAVASAGTNRLTVEGTAANAIDLTEITVTGAGSTTLGVDGTNAVVTNLTTVNAGSATGALTMNVSASTKAVTFTGSAGKNTIVFGNGDNVITGGAAADTFTLGTGKNTVTGGDGNDTVIGAVADFTSADSINLGGGTRDALIYNNVTQLNSTGVSATQLAALNGYSGIEVVGSSANNVTAIDASYFTQTVYRLTGTLGQDITMTNVAGDTLELRSGITANSNDALTVSGSLPNQTFTLELNGSTSLTLTGNDGAVGDAAFTIASGISTVNILSTTTASSTSGIVNKLTNAGTTNADYVVDNVSAGSFVLTGNVDFTIDKGKTAGFSKAVDFNAGNFTGALKIAGSTSADVITGGSGNDVIRGLGGNDVIDLTKGGKDTVVLEATGNGKDSITGFSAGNGGDVLDVGTTSAFITTPPSLTTITSLTGAASISDNSIIIVNFGAAIAGKNFAGADFGDLFGTGKVFSTTGTATTEAVIVVQGTDQTQVLYADIDSGTNTMWESGDIQVVGVLTDVTNAATFHITNFA